MNSRYPVYGVFKGPRDRIVILRASDEDRIGCQDLGVETLNGLRHALVFYITIVDGNVGVLRNFKYHSSLRNDSAGVLDSGKVKGLSTEAAGDSEHFVDFSCFNHSKKRT